MRIGILTFHSQLNYGGVLQCFALQQAIEQLGHEVYVIDRWLQPDNAELRGYWNSNEQMHLFKKLSFAIRMLPGWGKYEFEKRIKKTSLFLKNKLNLTSFHFYNWQGISRKELDEFDLLVVGSDQVWNPNCCIEDLNFYMLNNCPFSKKCVSYAVSLAVDAIPIEKRDFYREHLNRFQHISVREKRSVGLLHELGIKATYACDPTLLLDSRQWKEMIRLTLEQKKRKRLVCYFMNESHLTTMPSLMAFARNYDCDIQVLVDNNLSWHFFAPSIKHPSAFLKHWLNIHKDGIDYCLEAGPEDFVNIIYNSDCVLTDSYHGLMFSVIFRKNVRVLAPVSNFRKKMFARITDICENLFEISPIVGDIEEGLNDFRQGKHINAMPNQISSFRNESLSMLCSFLV